MLAALQDSLPFMLTGIVFGLAGGLTPGPLTTLVISQTLRYDAREGIRVAVTPLLTDAPIVALTILLLSRIAAAPVLAVIAVLGAAFLGYLAFESFRVGPLSVEAEAEPPRSLWKGFWANLLNPHPYVFWMTLGAPTVVKAARVDGLAPVLFVVCHYTGLVGSKMLLALLVERGRGLLGRAYVLTIRLLGVALLVFGVLFLRDGLGYLFGR
jgi:threonine/homoserine/homoserine lactone efflux protein